MLFFSCHYTFLFFYSLDFPLDVTIESFSYDNGIPTIKWKPVESGNCQVKYDLIISNQTAFITKESIEATSLQIIEMTRPLIAGITAIHGLRRGRTSDSFRFTKPTITVATALPHLMSTPEGNSNLTFFFAN